MNAIWIDDDGFRSRSLIDLLDLYGINVEFCANYDDGIAAISIRSKKIDLVILDIMMPPSKKNGNSNGQKTGIYLYSEIREFFKGL